MQITLGIGHLHEKDFIYRDLKLENVLMDENGNVCLTDFGMAKIIRDGELAQTFCGTPEYLAPEVLEGRGYNKAADWWSLGILTYEMMFGLPPFYHNSQKEMFRRIKEGEFRFSDKVKVSDEAKDFIVKMLRKDPNERLGGKGEANEILAHPWFADLDKEKMMRKEVNIVLFRSKRPSSRKWKERTGWKALTNNSRQRNQFTTTRERETRLTRVSTTRCSRVFDP